MSPKPGNEQWLIASVPQSVENKVVQATMAYNEANTQKGQHYSLSYLPVHYTDTMHSNKAMLRAPHWWEDWLHRVSFMLQNVPTNQFNKVVIVAIRDAGEGQGCAREREYLTGPEAPRACVPTSYKELTLSEYKAALGL